MADEWTMKGSIMGSCNCDWGCPCNFDVAPSYGHCDGVYVWMVEAGSYGDVGLDGVNFAWAAHSPGPLHEGNVKGVLIVDEHVGDEQRNALEELWQGGGTGLPFDILASVWAERLDTISAPIEVKLAGINSEVTIGGGDLYDLAMARVKNPVTGDEEELYLDKPTGFTSKRAELGMALRGSFACDGLSFDNAGKYAEYGAFEYAGP
jgi:hypothetical protein